MVRATGSTMMLKLSALALAFGASMLYARALGPAEYGRFAYVIAWTAVLTVPASLGLPLYLLKEAAKFPQQSYHLRRWADRWILASGILAALTLACAGLAARSTESRWLFLIAMPVPLLANFSAVRQSLLQAGGWIVLSQWPQQLLAPSLALGTLVLVWWWQGWLSPIWLMGATVIAAAMPVAINHWQARRLCATAPRASSRLDTHIRSALPFMWLGGLQLLLARTDLLLIGTLRGGHDAGLYAVASRAAETLLFIGLAANTVSSPKIASLYHHNEKAMLQRLLSAMARRVVLLTLPLAAGLIIFAAPLLTLLYGHEYTDAASTLQVLAIAQMVAVVGGPLGTLLNMSGNERLHLYGIGGGLVLSVALNCLLIPRHGAFGAAIGTCISLIASRLALLILVRHRLDVKATVFGI